MSVNPSTIFSNGTEYEVFKYNWCEKCRNYKEREDGFPALVDDGGCQILDAMEFARFDASRFPSNKVKELHDAEDGKIICWHYCIDFFAYSENEQFAYFEKMKRALIGGKKEK